MRHQINALRERIAQLAAENTRVLQAAHAENRRSLTPEEGQAVDARIADIERAKADLSRAEATLEASRIEAAGVEMIREDHDADDRSPEAERARCRQALRHFLANEEMPANLARFVGAPTRGGSSNRSIGVQGAFFVPTQVAGLLQAAEPINILRSLVRVIQTSTGEKWEVPTYDLQVEGEMVKPGANFIPSEAAVVEFGKGSLESADFTSNLMGVGYNLVRDSEFDILGFIYNEALRRIDRRLLRAVTLNEDPYGPEGLLPVVPVGRELPAGRAAPEWEDWVELYFSIPEEHRANGSVVASEDVVKSFMKKLDPDGRPIWVPSMRDGEPDRFGGRPLRTLPNMPSLAAGNKVMLWGDFSTYWLRQVGNPEVQDLPEQSKLRRKSMLIAWASYDGLATIRNAIKTMKVA
jgi:HK97 family phage major capsid protein